MEYLLMMTLSGGAMTALVWIVRRLLKDRIDASLYYLLAKAAVLYYLVPLPFLKKWYMEALRVIVPERQMESVEMEIAQVSLTWTKYVVRTEGRTYLNSYTKLQIAAVLIWLSVAGLLMIRQAVKYMRTARVIAGYIGTNMTDREEMFLAGVKEQYGVKRRVLLYRGEKGRTPITFGVFRPVILCDRDVESREAELFVSHEMVHIRRLDAVWKMIVKFVRLLHWYNPMAWLLRDEFDRICEISCDAIAVREKSEEERDLYGHLLIEEAQRKEEPKSVSLRWKADFKPELKRVKERVENLMSKKKWNRFAAGTLVAALIFANSMTVLAYREGYNEVVPEAASQGEIESSLRWDTVEFAPDETDGDVETLANFDEQEMDEILYDRQFTDEEGNVYMIPDVQPHWGCDHNYVSGTETGHDLKSDGSCEVTKYRAQRCSKCGLVVRGELISSHYYAVCPH